MFSDKLRPIRPFLDWMNNAGNWHFWNPGAGFKSGLFYGVLLFLLYTIF